MGTNNHEMRKNARGVIIWGGEQNYWNTETIRKSRLMLLCFGGRKVKESV